MNWTEEVIVRNRLSERIAISGVGCTRFGDLLETPEIKELLYPPLEQYLGR